MIRSAWWRLSGLFRRQQREHELADELESHLQMHTADCMRAGMTEEAARRKAHLELGGAERTKQAWRDAIQFHGLSTWCRTFALPRVSCA